MDGVAAHADDPQHVAEYCEDIFRNLQRDEVRQVVSADYMDRQVHVNSKMRAILIDWLVDVHKKYKLRSETLFLAVSIIDRYLNLKVTQQRHLQLVGVTALLIAAKFEEVYPPAIKDFVYVTDKAYSREDILNMEVKVLTALQFKICGPTAMTFLDRYQLVNGCTDAHRDLAQYLLELSLVDYKMIKYVPSHLAAASILLSNKLLRRPSWMPANVRQTKMTESMLKECAKEMCILLELAEQSQLQAIRKKYSQLKHHSVAKLNFMAPPSNATGDRATGTSRRMSTDSRRSSVSMDLA
jgi:cyclin B